ncbi:MAG: recombinase family protein [Clostridia bacterium]|nr:recombinase family protein [Clostridia bacterium]
MRMETGDFAFVNAPFGYKIEDDTLIPIPEEAEIVRRIFQYYLAGMGFGRIAQELNNNDAIGKPWGKERVRYILSNEKYIGDTLHQKTYTPTELPFRNRKNRGEVDQYYVSNSHEAILDKDVFYAVKEMLEKNLILNEEKAPVKRHKFTGKIFCSDCTWAYKMHVQNGITYWACSQNGTAGRRCVTHPMSEEIVERTFRNFYNKLKQHEGEILKSTYNRLIELKASITKSRSEVIAIDEELLALGERLTYLSRLLETRTLDKEVFNVRAADIKKKIADLRVKRRKLLADDEEEQCIEELRQTIAFMDEAPKAIIEYDHKLFNALIKRVLVEENRLVFELKCGITLREKIAWN